MPGPRGAGILPPPLPVSFLDQEGQNGGYAHDHAAGQEASAIDSDGNQTGKKSLSLNPRRSPTPSSLCASQPNDDRFLSSYDDFSNACNSPHDENACCGLSPQPGSPTPRTPNTSTRQPNLVASAETACIGKRYQADFLWFTVRNGIDMEHLGMWPALHRLRCRFRRNCQRVQIRG